MIRSLADCISKYGAIGDGKWADETHWCELFVPPTGLNWINSATGAPVVHIYCNSDMRDALAAALERIIHRGLVDQLKTFDGCLMVRDVRGEPGKPSTHSYALAIDINASTNRLGTEGDMSEELVACFTDSGFTWGGNFSRKDCMHFSFAWE